MVKSVSTFSLAAIATLHIAATMGAPVINERRTPGKLGLFRDIPQLASDVSNLFSSNTDSQSQAAPPAAPPAPPAKASPKKSATKSNKAPKKSTKKSVKKAASKSSKKKRSDDEELELALRSMLDEELETRELDIREPKGRKKKGKKKGKKGKKGKKSKKNKWAASEETPAERREIDFDIETRDLYDELEAREPARKAISTKKTQTKKTSAAKTNPAKSTKQSSKTKANSKAKAKVNSPPKKQAPAKQAKGGGSFFDKVGGFAGGLVRDAGSAANNIAHKAGSAVDGAVRGATDVARKAAPTVQKLAPVAEDLGQIALDVLRRELDEDEVLELREGGDLVFVRDMELVGELELRGFQNDEVEVRSLDHELDELD